MLPPYLTCEPRALAHAPGAYSVFSEGIGRHAEEQRQAAVAAEAATKKKGMMGSLGLGQKSKGTGLFGGSKAAAGAPLAAAGTSSFGGEWLAAAAHAQWGPWRAAGVARGCVRHAGQLVPARDCAVGSHCARGSSCSTHPPSRRWLPGALRHRAV
jgi:hypothetical protein